MDLIVAVVAAALVVGGVAFALGRRGVDTTAPGLGMIAGAIAGAAAALVFLVPQVDLLPDQFDAGAQLIVFAASGVAIAGLGWRRRRAP